MCPTCLKMCKKNGITFYCTKCYDEYCIYCCEPVCGLCECQGIYNEDDMDAVVEEFPDVLKCPVCRILISKEDGCCSMKCIYCKVKFCWGCGATNDHIEKYGHDCNNYGTFREEENDHEYRDGYDVGECIRD